MEAPITVVIPLHDGARFIGETLTSVERQTRRPARVVVVDDGSEDRGAEIVRAHGVGAELVGQHGLGVAVARNRGLAMARTPWVCFLDQDDLWAPKRLERVFSWLDRHREERLVMTTEYAFSVTEEQDALAHADPLVGAWASHRVPAADAYRQLCRQADTAGSPAESRYDHRAMLRGPISATTSFVASAELLRLAGGFAPHALAMDDYWLLVNASRIRPIVLVDQPTVFYRVHMSATSRSTRLALPFLSSAVALRLGGGLAGTDEALGDAVTTGPLHEHLFDELVHSPGFRRSRRVRRAAGALACLLWPDRRRAVLMRAGARARAGWLMPPVRMIRGLLGRRR